MEVDFLFQNRIKWKGKQKQWRKSFFAVMVVFTMLFTSMPVTILGNPTSYTVYVGGAEMTVSADGTSTSYYVNGTDGAQGTVSAEEPQTGWNAKLYYDTTAGCVVLEADGLVVKNAVVNTYYNAAIYSENSIAITFINTPSVIGGGDNFNRSAYGIYCKADLILQVNNSGTSITSVNIESNGGGSESYGICAWEDVSISFNNIANELNVTSGCGIGGSAGRTAGIHAGGDLTVYGGVIHATCGGNGTGYNAGLSGYNVIVNGGTIDAKGSTSGYESYGIRVGGI